MRVPETFSAIDMWEALFIETALCAHAYSFQPKRFLHLRVSLDFHQGKMFAMDLNLYFLEYMSSLPIDSHLFWDLLLM